MHESSRERPAPVIAVVRTRGPGQVRKVFATLSQSLAGGGGAGRSEYTFNKLATVKDDARIEKHHCCLRAIHQLMGTGYFKTKDNHEKRAQTKYHRAVVVSVG